MPILNRSKIRPDVLKLYDEVFKEQMKGIIEFTNREENKEFNFLHGAKIAQKKNTPYLMM